MCLQALVEVWARAWTHDCLCSKHSAVYHSATPAQPAIEVFLWKFRACINYTLVQKLRWKHFHPKLKIISLDNNKLMCNASFFGWRLCNIKDWLFEQKRDIYIFLVQITKTWKRMILFSIIWQVTLIMLTFVPCSSSKFLSLPVVFHMSWLVCCVKLAKVLRGKRLNLVAIC